MRDKFVKQYFAFSRISYYMAVALIFMTFNMVFFFLAYINHEPVTVHSLLVKLIADFIETGLFILLISPLSKRVTVRLAVEEPDAVVAQLEKKHFTFYRTGDDIVAYKNTRNAYFGGAFFFLKKQDGYEVQVARGCKNKVDSLFKG